MDTKKNKSILKLPDIVANRIAAGEIIERPSSLIKELIENSIDAYSTDIKIEIENGGINSIIIIDNGIGITGDDLPLAITHHATSKIKNIEDLDNIYTLGFRGEALASIGDVSRLEVRSKYKSEGSGYHIISEGGNTKSHAPYPISEGTTIIVKNLFYNLPARYKFLKQPSHEFISIKNIFDSFVISNFNISFSLQHNKGTLYSYRKTDSIKRRLKDYLEPQIYDELLEIETEYDDIKIFGYVSTMNIMQNYRKNSYILLNNRLIDNRTLSFAIKNAYKGVIPSDKFPYYYIYIKIDPSKVDVNVHPSKKEVRMKQERDIASLLYKEIISKLSQSSTLGHSIKSLIKPNAIEYNNTFSNSIAHDNSENTQNNYNRNHDNFYSNKSEYEKQNDNISSIEDNGDDTEESREENYKITNIQSEFGSIPKVVGQVFFLYIIVEYGDEILIIDQHAAYERLNYELIYKNISSKKIEYESLLIPFEITYKDYEIDVIEEAQKYLETIGLNFERTGKNTISIDKIPIYLSRTHDNEAIIKDILDNSIITDNNLSQKSVERFVKKSLERVACRYSPKANDLISHDDAQKLIDMLSKENILLSCPHGRPFIIRMSKDYLDKKFFR